MCLSLHAQQRYVSYTERNELNLGMAFRRTCYSHLRGETRSGVMWSVISEETTKIAPAEKIVVNVDPSHAWTFHSICISSRYSQFIDERQLIDDRRLPRLQRKMTWLHENIRPPTRPILEAGVDEVSNNVGQHRIACCMVCSCRIMLALAV